MRGSRSRSRSKRRSRERLLLDVTKSYDFGIYQAYLNGVKLRASIDLYSKDIATAEFHLLDFWPEPGKYTLRLECVGKNPALDRLLSGHRVRPPARAPPPRQRIPPRHRQRLAQRPPALRLNPLCAGAIARDRCSPCRASSSCLCYSYRSAFMGSIRAARRAGR